MVKKIEKIVSLCCAFVLIVIATVSGTLAYESMTADDFAASEDQCINVQLLRQRINNSGEYVDLTEDPVLFPLATGYTENIIRVKNGGNIDTYNRVLIAVPADLDDTLELVKGDSWQLTKTLRNQTCEDETCNIYIFTMNGSLKAETTSDPAVLGVRVNAALEQYGDTYILNDVIYDYSEGLQLKVTAQAIQTDGFANAEAAFTTAELPDNPWLGENN